MKIVLIRHFKVNYDWRFACNSLEFENACDGYDKSNVIVSDLRINSNNRIYSSTMIRAIETAKTIFNKPLDFSSDLKKQIQE